LTVSFSAIFPYKNPYITLAMRGFCKKNYRKNNHVKIVSLFLSHYLASFIEQFEREIKEINVKSDFLENEKYLTLKNTVKS